MNFWLGIATAAELEQGRNVSWIHVVFKFSKVYGLPKGRNVSWVHVFFKFSKLTFTSRWPAQVKYDLMPSCLPNFHSAFLFRIEITIIRQRRRKWFRRRNKSIVFVTGCYWLFGYSTTRIVQGANWYRTWSGKYGSWGNSKLWRWSADVWKIRFMYHSKPWQSSS